MGGAPNYQAIQLAKETGKKKKPTADKNENLDVSYLVYEVLLDGSVKFVKIL